MNIIVLPVLSYETITLVKRISNILAAVSHGPRPVKNICHLFNYINIYKIHSFWAAIDDSVLIIYN